jgi:hypothetical protein
VRSRPAVSRAQDVFDAKTAAHVLNEDILDLGIVALANAIPNEK